LCSLRPERLIKLNYEQKEYENRLKNKIELDVQRIMDKPAKPKTKRKKKEASKSLSALINI